MLMTATCHGSRDVTMVRFDLVALTYWHVDKVLNSDQLPISVWNSIGTDSILPEYMTFVNFGCIIKERHKSQTEL